MSRDEEFREKVRKTISGYNMICPGDTIVVAVSGGPDSVCLLHVLHGLSEEMGHRLVVAHFDHGWRPDEDEKETELVHSLARSLGLPFESARWSPGTGTAARSREDSAREARYAFLEEVSKRCGAGKIALGHHLNDQAETFLMRLLSGSGIPGLAAIPPCRDRKIIRPLIGSTRAEIEVYLKKREIPYCTDSSNTNTGYLRNRIRLELIPQLVQYQPRLIEHLGETASLLREESEFLDSLCANWVAGEAKRPADGSISVPIPSLLALPPVLKKRVIRHILVLVKGSVRRIGRKHIHAVEAMAGSGKPQACLNLPDRLLVRRSYESLHFGLREEKEGSAGFSYRLDGPGAVSIHEIGKTLSLAVIMRQKQDPGPSPWTAHLDADKVRYPLCVRNFRPGDRFIPLGMKGHKKIKDFFVDLKVPSEVRSSTPLLCQEDIPLWVAGYRIDERFKVTSSTRSILEVRLM